MTKLKEAAQSQEETIQSLQNKNLDLLSQNMKMTELLLSLSSSNNKPQTETEEMREQQDRIERERLEREEDLLLQEREREGGTTKAEVYAHEYWKKVDRIQQKEKEVQVLENGLLSHFRFVFLSLSLCH
jgi:hypothetical protein